MSSPDEAVFTIRASAANGTAPVVADFRVSVEEDPPVFGSFFYDFESGPPKVHEHDNRSPQGLGIFYEGRLVVFYTYECDIGDGIEDPDVHRDPPEIREAAMRMAINVVVHALTS